MTKEQVIRELYISVFKVVRRATLPSLEEFLKMKIGEILSESSPPDWPTYWQEVLILTIKSHFRDKHKLGIRRFDYAWFIDKNKVITQLVDHICENIYPIGE